MPLKTKIITTVFIAVMLLCTGFINRVFAAENIDIPVQEDEINQHPWQSYQTLKKFAQQYYDPRKKSTLSANTQVLLLLRRAQAENLLYFHQDLENTVKQAQQLITLKTPPYITSQFNVYAGIVAQRKGLYKKSIKLLTKAIVQATAAELPRIYIMAKGELAYTRSLSELYETSLNEIQNAYVDAFALEDRFLVATINETYGAIYGYLKEYNKSIEYYEKALESYQQLGYQAHMAEAIYGMASTYRYWQKYDLAIAKFKLYIEKVTYTPSKDIEFFGNYGLGMTYAEKGDCQHALPIIEKALALNGQIDYNAELYKRKASCFIKLGELKAAQQAIGSARQIFASIPELNGTHWQLEVNKIAARLASALGNNKQAYSLLLKYQQKYSVLQEKNSSDRLLKVRSALEIERRDMEISLLQQRAKVQNLLIDKKHQQVNIQRYLIVIVVVFIVVVLAFLIVQHKYTRKLFAISIRDSLSGLYNRKYIFEFLDEKLKLSQENQKNLAVIILDIDDFKFANDQYGHPFGDEVIKEISTICQQSHRSEDVAGRIGGEEFMCVLPNIHPRESKIIAQRILSNIADHNFLTETGELYSVTVSIGIAHINNEVSNSLDLYTQADKALYHAKQSGKNLIVSYQDVFDENCRIKDYGNDYPEPSA